MSYTLSEYFITFHVNINFSYVRDRASGLIINIKFTLLLPLLNSILTTYML